MDALLPQRDGFHFLYVLPLASDRVLLEDTYFSDAPLLDHQRSEREIMDYARENSLEVARVVRREAGVLPLPTRFLRPDFQLSEGPLVAGYQGGWFHPVTGYSFPVAVRVASAVAASEPETLRREVWPALLHEQYRQLRFGLLLNQLFFGAFAPEQRYRAIERFYRLPPAAVRRFYAMALTRTDRARILCGRPPRGFSFSRALTTGALVRGASS
jgi:lycopene beta-cyclase